MINFTKILQESFQYDNHTVGCMAWLYLLLQYNASGLDLSKWTESDKRMGISFPEALPYLNKNKYLTEKDGVIFPKNINKIKNDLLDYFMVDLNLSLNHYKHFTYFNKYDTDSYPIGKIPLELYEQYRIKQKTQASDDIFNQTDEEKNAHDILQWYITKYQNDNHAWPTKFNNLLNNKYLVDNKTYKLFRGINVSDSMYPDIKEGDIITIKSGISWTESFDVAKGFALGNVDGWLTKSTKLRKNSKGIILLANMPADKILLDFEYAVINADNKYDGERKFYEYEVVVKSHNIKCKVMKLYEHPIVEDNDIFSYQPTEKEKNEFGKINAGYVKPSYNSQKNNIKKKSYTHCDILIDGHPFKADVPIALAKHIKNKEESSRTKGSVTFTNYR